MEGGGNDNPQGEQRVRGGSSETEPKDYEMLRIICFGGLAGSFGGCSVLLAKSTAELVKNALFEDGAYAFKHSPVPYIIIVLMICCLLTQITILNKGLSRFNALLMVPVYQSFWNGSSVLGGIIYFQEYVWRGAKRRAVRTETSNTRRGNQKHFRTPRRGHIAKGFCRASRSVGRSASVAVRTKTRIQATSLFATSRSSLASERSE